MVNEVGFADVHVPVEHVDVFHVSEIVGLVIHMKCTTVPEFTFVELADPRLLLVTVFWPVPPASVGVQVPVHQSATTVLDDILASFVIIGALNIMELPPGSTATNQFLASVKVSAPF